MYNYNLYGSQPTPEVNIDLNQLLGSSGATGAAAALVILLSIIVLAVVVLVIVANCKIFAKAGEKWWKGLIPLYNSWVQLRIGGLAWYWFLIFVVLTALIGVKAGAIGSTASMLLVLTSFNFCYNLAKKFGKTGGFALLMLILPFIGLPILAFGSDKYNKDAKVDPNGIFAVER